MNLKKKRPKSGSFKKLPIWNLQEFYKSPESDLINKDLPNNSFLMVKGSNSTGLNKIIHNL